MQIRDLSGAVSDPMAAYQERGLRCGKGRAHGIVTAHDRRWHASGVNATSRDLDGEWVYRVPPEGGRHDSEQEKIRGLAAMTFQTRGLCLAVTLGMVAMAAPACAQENLDQGKSAQQLFASDCAI